MLEHMEEKSLIRGHLLLLGFNEDEIRVYLALVSYGAMTLSALSETSGVERTGLYRMLDDLQAKGLIAIEEESKRKIIFPGQPGSLSYLVHDEELRLARLRTGQRQFETLVQSITGDQSTTKFKFYNGLESIKQAIWNNLNHQRQDIYSFRQQTTEAFFGDLFTRDYAHRLDMAGIHNHIATQIHDNKNHERISYHPIEPEDFKITKDFDVYDNTTLYYNWDSEAYAVEVYDPSIAATNRQLVQLLLKMHQ